MKNVRKKSIIWKFFCKTLNIDSNIGRTISSLTDSQILEYASKDLKDFSVILIYFIFLLFSLILSAAFYLNHIS